MPDHVPRPRCKACGKRMADPEIDGGILVYECDCGHEKVVPKPNRVTAEFRRKYL